MKGEWKNFIKNTLFITSDVHILLDILQYYSSSYAIFLFIFSNILLVYLQKKNSFTSEFIVVRKPLKTGIRISKYIFSWVYFPKVHFFKSVFFPMCIFPKCIFSKRNSRFSGSWYESLWRLARSRSKYSEVCKIEADAP